MSTYAVGRYALQLLDAATRCIGRFDLDFAQRYWRVPADTARRRLNRLERLGLITSREVFASSPPRVSQALSIWRPGQPIPNCGSIAYRARARWDGVPVKVRKVYHATADGRALIGRESCKKPRDIQASHDLGVAETFLFFLRQWPVLTRRGWRHESEYAATRPAGFKVEDAQIVRGENVLLLIDYAGAYRDDRVAELFEHAAEFQTPIAIF